MAGLIDYPRRSKRGEPVWEMASFYPPQGHWSEEDYLGLETNRLIEYHDGVLEFLPMPKIPHQRLIRLLMLMLQKWVDANRGEVFTAGTRLKVAEKEYREPDLALILEPGRHASGDDYFSFADLVIEVVSNSEEDRKRDYEEKREDYAKAGIPEYWIVDPAEKRITVLTLKRGKYIEHSKAGKGDTAESALLKGFKVSAEIFAAK